MHVEALSVTNGKLAWYIIKFVRSGNRFANIVFVLLASKQKDSLQS